MAAPFLPEGFAISSSSVSVGGGAKAFVLDDGSYVSLPDGYIVQAEAEEDTDQWMVGVWQRTDATNGTLHVGSASGRDYSGSDTFTVWRLKVVAASPEFLVGDGFSSTSLEFGSSHDIFVGATVSLTTDTNKLFNPGTYVVLFSSDASQYFRGISQSYDPSTGDLTLFVTDVGATASGAYDAWSLFAQDGPSVSISQIATSTSSVTVDFSLGFSNLTFTIPAEKNIFWGGRVLITLAENSGLWVQAYVLTGNSGTSLVVRPELSSFSSPTYGTYSNWIIQSLAPSAISGVILNDTNDQSKLVIIGSNDDTATANRGLALNLRDGDRTVTLHGDLNWPDASGASEGDTLALDGSLDPQWTARAKTVASGSFPAQATLDVAIPAGYSDILISWDGVSSGTATRTLMIQVATDGVPNFDTTAGNYPNIRNTTDLTGLTEASTASLVQGTNMTAAQTSNGVAVIEGYSSAGFKPFHGYARMPEGSAAYFTNGFYKGGSGAAITYIRFLWNGSGNFDAGTYVVSVK